MCIHVKKISKHISLYIQQAPWTLVHKTFERFWNFCVLWGQSRVLPLCVHKVKMWLVMCSILTCTLWHADRSQNWSFHFVGHLTAHFLVATAHSSSWMKHDLCFSLHASFTSFLWGWIWGARTQKEHKVSISVSQRWHSLSMLKEKAGRSSKDAGCSGYRGSSQRRKKPCVFYGKVLDNRMIAC